MATMCLMETFVNAHADTIYYSSPCHNLEVIKLVQESRQLKNVAVVLKSNTSGRLHSMFT